MPATRMSQTQSPPVVFGTGLIALDLVLSADFTQPIRACAGGTCGNVISILSFLGWDAFPVARLNGDAASMRVKADLRRWGVHLDHAECAPAVSTPIIVQEIRVTKHGKPKHQFVWRCPTCGTDLPRYKPLTLKATESLAEDISRASVFFLDRLSNGALRLAQAAAEAGAVVVFEPSGTIPEKLLLETLKVSHIVKYSDQRIKGLDNIVDIKERSFLEIQTLGARGLRYRSGLPGSKILSWRHLEAFKPASLVDTCGAGDWCTAVLISRLCHDGSARLCKASIKNVETALNYAQAAAAWSCAFEGARGGMYSVTRTTFDGQVDEIVAGTARVHHKNTMQEVNALSRSEAICPACSPSSGTRRGRRTRAREVAIGAH